MDVHALESRLLEDGEVWEEFNEDNYFVGRASNCPPPSFHITMDCHEGYMLICVLEMRHMLNQFGGKDYVSTEFCNL